MGFPAATGAGKSGQPRALGTLPAQ
jgi:hypothetical protein